MRGFLPKARIRRMAATIVAILLMALRYMVATAFKERTQLTAPGALLWSAVPAEFEWNGELYPVYRVHVVDGQVHSWALVDPGRESSVMVDTANPDAGEFVWEG